VPTGRHRLSVAQAARPPRALSSRSIGVLAPGLTITQQPFGATASCAALMADPCRRPPPR
jgi:hypothetical protein